MAKTPELEPGEPEKETPAQQEMSAVLKNMAEAVEAQKPEGQQPPATEKGEPAGDKMSRRSFLKKAAMGLAAAFIAPEAFAEGEKPLLDIVVEGQRVVFRREDIERMEKSGEALEKTLTEEISESFNPEIQQAIVKNIGDKLKAGLLKAQELGFKINARDTQHVHLLMGEDFNKSFKEKHLNADGVTWAGVATPVSKEDMISLTGEVRGLIFHCAEFPSKEELTSEEFMKGKYTHRSVVVNERNQTFDAITKHPRERGDGQIPDLGIRAIDYNDLEGKNYQDLAEIYKSYAEFHSDLKFLPASEEDGGVRLDPRLPALKFVLSGYRPNKSETKK